MFKKAIYLLIVLIIVFDMGFFAGFSVRESKIKQETINSQQKQINNTVELKKEVLKIDGEIKKYEMACYDILNFDIADCLP